MRGNEAASSGLRVLTEAEIAMVAGGTHLDEMMVPDANFHWMDDSHTFAEKNGMIAADYDHDGSYEEGWRPNSECENGWERTTVGWTWQCSTTTPDQERAAWYSNHQYWITVEP